MNKNLLFISLFSVIFYTVSAQETSVEFSILDINAKESANVSAITSFENNIAFVAEMKADERNVFTYDKQNGIKGLLNKSESGKISSYRELIKFNDSNLFFISEKNNTSYLNVLNI